jgi:hypothetical protein
MTAKWCEVGQVLLRFGVRSQPPERIDTTTAIIGCAE